jgi:hypothetical protein
VISEELAFRDEILSTAKNTMLSTTQAIYSVNMLSLDALLTIV